MCLIGVKETYVQGKKKVTKNFLGQICTTVSGLNSHHKLNTTHPIWSGSDVISVKSFNYDSTRAGNVQNYGHIWKFSNTLCYEYDAVSCALFFFFTF